jgi:hypothetical protein
MKQVWQHLNQVPADSAAAEAAPAENAELGTAIAS